MMKKYCIYNKQLKRIIKPVREVILCELNWCIDEIRKELGGNSNLVVVYNPLWLKQELKKISYSTKVEAVNYTIETLGTYISKIDKGISYEYAKHIKDQLLKACDKLKAAFKVPDYNILYEIDGYSVVYDRTFLKKSRELVV